MKGFFEILWHILRIVLGVALLVPFLLFFLIAIIWGACIDSSANSDDMLVAKYGPDKCAQRKAERKEKRRNKNLDLFLSYFEKMFT